MKWFLSIMLLIVVRSYGQDTLTKYIVVDTITIDEGINTDAYYFCDFLRKADDKFISFENSYWGIQAHPSFCSKVRYLSGNDLTFRFRLDNRMGNLELHNLENAGDTIHLLHYRIYNNCRFDSFKTSSRYYHHFNDTTKVLYKYKSETQLPNSACDTLTQVFLTINGRNYLVPIKSSHVTLEAIYCNGSARKRDELRRNKYEYLGKRKNKRIKFNTFSASTLLYGYEYYGRLDFQ